MLNRWLQALHWAEDVLLASLLTALLVLSISQIGLRLVFDSGLVWAEPLARSGVFWLAMLGALGATRTRKHIAIDALPRLLPDTGQRIVWGLSHLFAAMICGALCWYGSALVASEFGAPVPWVAGLSSAWPMLALPVGFGLMAIRFVLSAWAGPSVETYAESGS